MELSILFDPGRVWIREGYIQGDKKNLFRWRGWVQRQPFRFRDNLSSLIGFGCNKKDFCGAAIDAVQEITMVGGLLNLHMCGVYMVFIVISIYVTSILNQRWPAPKKQTIVITVLQNGSFYHQEMS